MLEVVSVARAIQLLVDESILAALDLDLEALEADFRKRLAVSYYRDGRLSLGKAAEMAGMGYRAFWDYLVQHDVPVVVYDEKDLAADLGAYEKWKSGR